MAVPRLSDLIIKYKERANLSYSQIGKKAKLPHRTIQSWAMEYSIHPRRWQDLVQFADAVDLNCFEIDELLQTAGHPTVESLRHQGEDIHLLKKWEQKKSVYQIPRTPTAIYRGRKIEQEKIESLLFKGEKMCVIQGMGGIGKSALAVQMAQRLLHHFPDGVLWADLRNVGVIEILENWAYALGVKLPQVESMNARAAIMWGILSRKTALVILDDVVGLSQARKLLPSYQTPCSIIATTRSKEIANSLVTSLENILSLEPMHLDTSLMVVKDILGEGEVNTNILTITEICDLLGHLPLALNIFARRQRVSTLPLETTLDKLRNIKTRLMPLKIGDEAVRTAFEQSWGELGEELQETFIAMAIFSGRTFHLKAFAKILGIEENTIAERIEQLQILFLVAQVESDRYQQHPLLAAWANEMIEQDSKHWLSMARYYVQFAQENQHSYVILMPEWQNIMAGMSEAYSLEEWQLVLAYMNILQPIWTEQGQYQSAIEGLEWARIAAKKLELLDNLGFTYLQWGIACIELSDYQGANEKLQLALQHSENPELADLRGNIHFNLSRIRIEQDNYSEAYQELQTAWRYFQETENVLGMANALYQMGDLEYYRGNYSNALNIGEDALKLHIEIDNVIGQMQTLMLMATTTQELKDLAKSRAYIQMAEDILERVNDKAKQAGFYYSSANLLRLQNEFNQAHIYANKSLALFRETGKLFSETNVLNLIALVELDWSENEPDQDRSLQAIHHATESMNLCEHIHYDHGKVSAILTLGKGLRQTGNYEEACNKWNEALSISRRLQNNFLTHRLEELLAETN
jgi:tetratricopeptide (TPR) repeat protein